MKRAVAALALVLLAAQADAGVKDVIVPGLYYAALNYCDYRTSVDAMGRGGVELNPVLKSVGPKAGKIGAAILMTGVDVLLQKDKHKATVWTYRVAVGVILGAVAIRNSQVNRGIR